MLDYFKKKNPELAVNSEYHNEFPHHAGISDSKLCNITLKFCRWTRLSEYSDISLQDSQLIIEQGVYWDGKFLVYFILSYLHANSWMSLHLTYTRMNNFKLVIVF